MLCAFLVLPVTPAGAQCRLCGSEGDRLVTDAPNKTPVQLEVETSLDFDNVVLVGAGGGTARLSPDGSRTTSGGLQGLSSRAMIGEVTIRGEPGRSVRVDFPGRIDLFGAAGSLSISAITSDLVPAPRLDSEGRLRIRFGGELFVSGDAEGQYRGDVAITVEYL